MHVPEFSLYWRHISHSIDRLLHCLEGMSVDDLNWTPAPQVNSLHVLATHTLASTAESILGTLCGQVVMRQREAEFSSLAAQTTAIHIQWQILRDQIDGAVAQLSDDTLDQDHSHPRLGQLSGREVLLMVARHTAEHAGQAELTRELLLHQRGRFDLEGNHVGTKNA